MLTEVNTKKEVMMIRQVIVALCVALGASAVIGQDAHIVRSLQESSGEKSGESSLESTAEPTAEPTDVNPCAPCAAAADCFTEDGCQHFNGTMWVGLYAECTAGGAIHCAPCFPTCATTEPTTETTTEPTAQIAGACAAAPVLSALAAMALLSVF